MKGTNLPHVGKMSMVAVELKDGREGIIDYRQTTDNESTVMMAIKQRNGSLGAFQPTKINKIAARKAL